MSGDDLLARATRALRETTEPAGDLDGTADVATTTLARIERSSRAARVTTLRRRKYTRWIVMPMAASFVVFAAWASASGRLGHWIAMRSHDEVERSEPAPPEPVIERPLLLPAAPAPTARIPAPEPTPEPTPEVLPSAAPPPPVKKTRTPSADADALYREAHEAHFVRRDPAAALAAWDRYLAAAGPGGRFTLEARYNRAVSLVRLGRRDEAAAALRPFANGEYGGYRRDEAAKLLHTLE